jgi:hypothetical protein
MVGRDRPAALAGLRVRGIAAAGLIICASVAGCGPSEADIRASLADVCVDIVEGLSELPAGPLFEELPGAADAAGYEVGGGAYQVEKASSTEDATAFADALHALSDAYRDLDRQITTRDYRALAQTRLTGEAALADALTAARALGLPDCEGVGLRVDYFGIAADGADAALARIAPTGDYVVDVDAACARYSADTLPVYLKVGLGSLVETDGEVTAGEYIEAIEDILVIERSLGVLVRELEALTPSAADAASHARLLDGLRGAVDAVRLVRSGDEAGELAAAAEQISEAAENLGVTCSL